MFLMLLYIYKENPVLHVQKELYAEIIFVLKYENLHANKECFVLYVQYLARDDLTVNLLLVVQ